MGARFSSTQLIELFNNVHVVLGSGMLGVLFYLWRGMNTYAFKTTSLAFLTGASLHYVLNTSDYTTASRQKIIFITGCDSGLGFSLAIHASDMGFTVMAGCLNISSEGAKELKLFPGIYVFELDITKEESVKNAIVEVDMLVKNEQAILWALVNNAGVMTFGEFEWLTERLIYQQLDVNLFGTMRITKALSPMLRKYSGRIITISSHCAKATLPGLSVYGATKAGISAWCDGLRVELNKYGVKVITFMPGSFVQQSNILAKQNESVFEMQSAMTTEQIAFYGDYFKQYNAYLSALSGERLPRKIKDVVLYEKFKDILLDKNPAAHYKHETWKYTFYHTLFKISPVRLRDYFVVNFIQMPKWEKEKKINAAPDIIA